MEIRKPVVGYEGLYEVSNFGRIKSLSKYLKCNTGGYFTKDKILVSYPDIDGYLRVTLCNKQGHKATKTHRIVAQAFIPNYDGKPQINHKNGIRTDNIAENLERCTSKENINHSFKELGRQSNLKGKLGIDNPNSIKIIQKTPEGVFIKLRDSMSDVSRELGIDNSTLSKCSRGIYKTSGGYKRERFIGASN